MFPFLGTERSGTGNADTPSEEHETGNVSEQYDMDDDELERHHSKCLDTANLLDNPLNF